MDNSIEELATIAKVLNKITSALQLPVGIDPQPYLQIVDNVFTRTVNVPVPTELSSLFCHLQYIIKVTFADGVYHFTVEWKYTHQNGSYNGKLAASGYVVLKSNEIPDEIYYVWV
jgi:hypothetical protein